MDSRGDEQHFDGVYCGAAENEIHIYQNQKRAKTEMAVQELRSSKKDQIMSASDVGGSSAISDKCSECPALREV